MGVVEIVFRWIIGCIKAALHWLFLDAITFYTLVLTVTGAIAAGISYTQWQSLIRAEAISDRSAKAAKDSADVARETLIAAQRPWIDADLSVGSNLTFSAQELKLSFRYTLHNLGNTPAINVEMRPQFFLFDFGSAGDGVNVIPQTDPAAELEKLCTFAASMSEGAASAHYLLGDMIFPGRKLSDEMILSIRREEINNARRKSFYHSISPILLTCVTYRFPFDTKSHYTGRIFQILRHGFDSTGAPADFSKDEGTVPASELYLAPYFFRSGFAN